MKKLLGTTLALAMLVPAGANAELLKNLKVSGQLDIQTTSARNVNDFVTRPASGSVGTANTNNDRIGHATTRVIVKMDWDILDDVHSRVTLVKGAHDSGAGVARTYGTDAQTSTDILDMTFIQEANVKIDKLMGAVDVTAGRQFYGEEGDLIVYYGPRDAYGMRVDAIDMFRADWNGEHMSITGIAGKTADGTVTTVGETNTATDLRGLVVSCKMHEMVKPSLYIYNRVNHAVGGTGVTTNGTNGNTNGKNTNLWVAGIKAKIALGGLALHAELVGNRGEDRTTATNSSYKGWAFLTKAAYKLDLSDLGVITPWGELGYGTGDSNGTYGGNRDFQSINTDYRPGAIYGRFDRAASLQIGNNLASGTNGTVASNGLTNRTIWGGGVKVTPAAINKLTVGAAYWRFAYNRLAQQVVGASSTRRSRNIGSEVDATAEWKHSENVSLKATAGSFLPGAGIADIRGANAALNPVVMLAGDVSIKF